jgi:hypothetical protein
LNLGCTYHGRFQADQDIAPLREIQIRLHPRAQTKGRCLVMSTNLMFDTRSVPHVLLLLIVRFPVRKPVKKTTRRRTEEGNIVCVQASDVVRRALCAATNTTTSTTTTDRHRSNANQQQSTSVLESSSMSLLALVLILKPAVVGRFF